MIQSPRGTFYASAIACALAFVVGGCSGGGVSIPTVAAVTPSGSGFASEVAVPTSASGATSALPVVASGAAEPASSALNLQAGDKVKVTVFGEDKISGEYELDPNGFVSLPLAGTVKAAGSSKVELEQLLTQKLRSNYLKDPKVTVDVVSFRPIYVLGEVQKPGEYPFKSGLNVMSAIAVAGGSTYRASNSRVLIQRFGEKSLKEYQLDPGVQVMPGDVVRLPERYF